MNDNMEQPLSRLAVQYVGERLRRGDIQPITAKGYGYHLNDFLRSYGNRPAAQLGPRAAERWLEQMERSGVSPSTRALRVSTVKGFARWCVQYGHAPNDWMVEVRKIRRKRQVSRDVTEGHVDLVLAVCQDTRDVLIIELMRVDGLRCVEVVRLDVEDYDVISGTLHITGKGGHERVAHVVGPLKRALENYLAETGARSGPLIRRQDGRYGRLNAATISRRVSHLFAAAGLKIRPYDGRSGHGIRACAASDLLESCGDLKVVQEFLGHIHLSTTDHYIRARGSKLVRSALEERFTPPSDPVSLDRCDDEEVPGYLRAA